MTDNDDLNIFLDALAISYNSPILRILNFGESIYKKSGLPTPEQYKRLLTLTQDWRKKVDSLPIEVREQVLPNMEKLEAFIRSINPQIN